MAVLQAHGQSREARKIVSEGKKLYKTEMASWYGTDIFMEKFEDKAEYAGGYFSYVNGDRNTCVFFSNAETPRILASFTFDSTFNVNKAIVDGTERGLTNLETDLYIIRQAALHEYQTDTLFRSYKDMNPNFIPLSDNEGKRVYVLTGPTQQGIVVFGNDYLLKFDKRNNLKDKRRIHKSLIPIEYAKDGQVAIGAMHSHLPQTGDLITPTDICTLMLYSKFAKWGTHVVLSNENVSIWDCNKNSLAVMTRKEWDKLPLDKKP